MNTKIIINAVVSIILVMAVAIPIISQMAEDVHSVEYNSEVRYFASDVVEEEITFSVSNNALLMNGAPVDVSIGSASNPFIIMDDCIFAFKAESGIITMYESDSSTDVTSITINTDGTFAYMSNNSEVTGDYDTILHVDPDGDYAAIVTGSSSEQLGINHGESVFIYNSLYNATYGNIRSVYMVVDSAVTTILKTDGTATTVTYNAIPTVISSDDMSNIVEFDRTMTVDGTSMFGSQVIYVPYQYSVVSDMDGVTKTLIGIVPVLLVVGIIIAVVYGSVLRRD